MSNENWNDYKSQYVIQFKIRNLVSLNYTLKRVKGWDGTPEWNERKNLQGKDCNNPFSNLFQPERHTINTKSFEKRERGS